MKKQFCGIAICLLACSLMGCGSQKASPEGLYVCEMDSDVTVEIENGYMVTCNMDTENCENAYGVIMGLAESRELKAEGMEVSDEERSELYRKYAEEVDYSQYANAKIAISEGETTTDSGAICTTYYAVDEEGKELTGIGFSYYPETDTVEMGYQEEIATFTHVE